MVKFIDSSLKKMKVVGLEPTMTLPGLQIALITNFVIGLLNTLAAVNVEIDPDEIVHEFLWSHAT